MKPALFLTACIVGLVSLFLVFPAAFAQDQPSVSSVTLHRDDAGQERIRIKLVGTHAPQVFAYHGDNPRLICDFPGAGYAGLVKPVIRGEGTLVRGIRVGVHNPPDKKVRVVLDLQPGRKYTYDREFNKEENILNIVLLPMAGARKAEDAVAGIDASESKQIVITGPKKVRHSPAAREEISPAGPPPAAAAAAPAAEPQVPPQAKLPPPPPAEPQVPPQAKLPPPPPAAPAQDSVSPAKGGESAATTPLLQEISYENSSSKGEMIFFRLNGFFPPTVSAVESDAPQIVCDFTGMALAGDSPPVIEARGAYVRRIVTTVDRDPRKIKVILELTAGRDYDLRQVFFKDDNLFVLIVNALDEERAAGPGDDGGR